MTYPLTAFDDRRLFAVCLLLLGGLSLLRAQSLEALAPDAPSAAPAPTAAPASNPAPAPAAPAASQAAPAPSDPSAFLGKTLPWVDPSTDIASWDGKHWNIANNRAFRARFEKFLNSPEATDAEHQAYSQLIESILAKLAPVGTDGRALDEAWELLPQASNYAIDAHLCDALADAVYSVRLARREAGRLRRYDDALERQRQQLEWNRRLAAQSVDALNSRSADPAQAALQLKDAEQQRALRLQPYESRLAEVTARIQANNLRREANELKTKVEFQALALQFFFQRRFQHVLIANRFYRSLFGDGDTELRVDGQLKQALTQGSGLPPTLGVLDSLANEAVRDVSDGLDAYRFLLKKEELASASERLAEAFAIGEFLPAIRQLSRDDKRRALHFAQLNNRLLSAIEVKDFAAADALVTELRDIAKDFDASKPLAAIETAKTVSGMHLSKARLAAISGDREALESEMRAAMEIWPRNPELAQVSQTIFKQTDLQQQALIDLDRLIDQKNYRQIYEDSVRFIAATALYPEKQERLRTILADMQTIEGALMRAQEVAKRGDHAGAWESIERAFEQFPEDPKLNQFRAEYTTHASEFVRSLRRAQALELTLPGCSLAWFLRAQRLYPASEFAQEGIARLARHLFEAPQLPPASSELTATAR